MGDFCSPSVDKTKSPTCFSKESLLKLIESWNKLNPKNLITYKSNSSNKDLWNLLDNKLQGVCSKGSDWCWTGALENMASSHEIKKEIKDIAKKELKPEKPTEWLKNPIAWLSNYDIENVMRQYHNNKEYNYVFLGVFPIDFSVKNKFGKCLFSEICDVNIKKQVNNKKQHIGFITNLDKHDQPGSHWTSTFIVLDPKLKSYGAYYYDSTARQIPSHVLNFLKDIKKQCDELHPTKKFIITYNKKQHQRKGTECGVFSIVYQIRWLKSLKINPEKACFDLVINNENITDEVMYGIRDKLYRPNIKSVLKK